jgi:pimeloyl-ACP methyl ester carboxylesterase
MLSSDAATGLDGLSNSFPEVDKEALRGNKVMGLNIIESMQQGLKGNCDGWVDDNLAMMAPWGFNLDEIKVPIFLYQGKADNTVPYTHGEWLAEHLPQEKLKKHLLEDQGHISIYIGHEESILDELLETAEM